MTTILNQPVALTGAGRTDAGVHAKEMFAHFDVEDLTGIPNFIFRLNSLLPVDIAVKDIFKVLDDAHARFNALSRTYEYHITKAKDPFMHNTAHYIKKELNIEDMNRAALLLIGKKDFECFSKSNTEVFTNICDLTYAKWEVNQDHLIFTITADRFLRNMVRAIVGTLINVGVGKYGPNYVNTILKSKDRSKAGVSVPAKGLYLTSIVYPNTILKNG